MRDCLSVAALMTITSIMIQILKKSKREHLCDLVTGRHNRKISAEVVLGNSVESILYCLGNTVFGIHRFVLLFFPEETY